MYRRTSVLIIRENKVLLVKLKDSDKLLPRSTWVFPFLDLKEDSSPRMAAMDMLREFSVNAPLANRTFIYSPSENPKITYFLYVVNFDKGEPEVGRLFQTYKWVLIRDMAAYFTSFMDTSVSRYLNEIANNIEKSEI